MPFPNWKESMTMETFLPDGMATTLGLSARSASSARPWAASARAPGPTARDPSLSARMRPNLAPASQGGGLPQAKSSAFEVRWSRKHVQPNEIRSARPPWNNVPVGIATTRNRALRYHWPANAGQRERALAPPETGSSASGRAGKRGGGGRSSLCQTMQSVSNAHGPYDYFDTKSGGAGAHQLHSRGGMISSATRVSEFVK